jgi:hypothetical protein
MVPFPDLHSLFLTHGFPVLFELLKSEVEMSTIRWIIFRLVLGQRILVLAQHNLARVVHKSLSRLNDVCAAEYSGKISDPQDSRFSEYSQQIIDGAQYSVAECLLSAYRDYELVCLASLSEGLSTKQYEQATEHGARVIINAERIWVCICRGHHEQPGLPQLFLKTARQLKKMGPESNR